MTPPVIMYTPFEVSKEIPAPKDHILNVKQNIISVILMFILAMNYLVGVVEACKGRLWVEILISIVMPLGLLISTWWTNDKRYFSGRVLQLCCIESIYNVSAIFALSAIYTGWEYGAWLSGYGFVIFYAFQYLGFAVKAFTMKRWHGVFQGTLLISSIAMWYAKTDDISTLLDGDLRVLMWGSDASWNIKAMYCVWAANSLLCDAFNIPKLTTVIVHAASITVSCLSGEFFHVRLLTACHLFFLDGWFGYAWMATSSSEFCTIPHKYQRMFFNTIQPRIAQITSTINFIIFVKNLAGY